MTSAAVPTRSKNQFAPLGGERLEMKKMYRHVSGPGVPWVSTLFVCVLVVTPCRWMAALVHALVSCDHVM